MALDSSKKPFMHNYLSLFFTMGLTYATCVTKDSLVLIIVILFCNKDMMLLNCSNTT